MKLFFDQNLSHRLCRILADVFPDSEQVKQVKLDRANDDAVWAYARRKGHTIVTLDADFAEMAALRGPPPKVIWLRCGNRPTAFVERLLRDRAKAIETFSESADAVTGWFILNGNIRITLEAMRVSHISTPGPANRVVIGRLVMPTEQAEQMAKGLLAFIEAQRAQVMAETQGAPTVN